LPKSQLDWLGVASLWLGTLIMAVKAADFSLMTGAPDWLAASWWNYVPLALVSVYVVIAIYRQYAPISPAPRTSSPAAQPTKQMPSVERVDPSDILPQHVSDKYVELMTGSSTKMQERRFLKLYVGKWLELKLRVISLDDQKEWIRAICRPDTESSYNAIVAYFKPQWEDHIQHIRKGDLIHFRARISEYKGGNIVLDYAEPI
jgi:hypothetical protein